MSYFYLTVHAYRLFLSLISYRNESVPAFLYLVLRWLVSVAWSCWEMLDTSSPQIMLFTTAFQPVVNYKFKENGVVQGSSAAVITLWAGSEMLSFILNSAEFLCKLPFWPPASTLLTWADRCVAQKAVCVCVCMCVCLCLCLCMCWIRNDICSKWIIFLGSLHSVLFFSKIFGILTAVSSSVIPVPISA